MRRRVSIGCTSAFPSIETFSTFLTCFFGPKGILDANVLAVSKMCRAVKSQSAAVGIENAAVNLQNEAVEETSVYDLSANVFLRLGKSWSSRALLI